MTRNINKPKNQRELALHYLYIWDVVTMKKVINDSLYHKFNTRLSELEIEFGDFTNKKRVEFVNRFGRKSSYLEYSAKDRDKLIEIFDKLN